MFDVSLLFFIVFLFNFSSMKPVKEAWNMTSCEKELPSEEACEVPAEDSGVPATQTMVPSDMSLWRSVTQASQDLCEASAKESGVPATQKVVKSEVSLWQEVTQASQDSCEASETQSEVPLTQNTVENSQSTVSASQDSTPSDFEYDYEYYANDDFAPHQNRTLTSDTIDEELIGLTYNYDNNRKNVLL